MVPFGQATEHSTLNASFDDYGIDLETLQAMTQPLEDDFPSLE
jgi:hypothetical protein